MVVVCVVCDGERSTLLAERAVNLEDGWLMGGQSRNSGHQFC